MFFCLVLGKGFAVMVLAPHLQSPQKDCRALLPVQKRFASWQWRTAPFFPRDTRTRGVLPKANPQTQSGRRREQRHLAQLCRAA